MWMPSCERLTSVEGPEPHAAVEAGKEKGRRCGQQENSATMTVFPAELQRFPENSSEPPGAARGSNDAEGKR